MHGLRSVLVDGLSDSRPKSDRSPVHAFFRRLFGLTSGESTRTDSGSELRKARRWRLLQVESALSCNLRCVMCPWKEVRERTHNRAVMERDVWEAVRPHLPDVVSVDFTGGGEPLLQPRLAQMVAEAKSAGCETGILTNALLLNPNIADELISSGLDWLCVSIDGADKETYERIREGSNFERICDNLAQISRLRRGAVPKTMINFVMMPANVHQLEDIVRLAGRLGVDQVNFKQCEVIRGAHGKGYGLFETSASAAVKRFEKSLARARSLAKKLRVATTASPFTPYERPVCEQDPRGSMFVRYDGIVGPCISCAYGGPTTFLGRHAIMPGVDYGRLPEENLLHLWESDVCRFYRERFDNRCREYDNTFLESLATASLSSPERLHEIARKRMPEAPESCQVCHYLYGI
ncbi:MAG TPA: radical SAM protein [Desulfomonilaceae bacterium]|nr:radical SAM protein [Desulfomonilaceae bacterium]